MRCYLLPAFIVLLAVAPTHAQSSYVYRAQFMCRDGDSCRALTAVENKYPESALFLNIDRIGDDVIAITVGKDWSAKLAPVSLWDTTLARFRVGDTAYFYDANNDGRQDIMFVLENEGRNGIFGQIDKWIVLAQGEHGRFEMLHVWQYGNPLWRRNRRNYWLSDRLMDSELHHSRYWVEDLFELKGNRFVNVGPRFGFPRLREFVGRVPKLTKKLRRSLYESDPGTEMERIR